MTGEASNPYLGILFFLVCPALFFAGLALMPLGIWLRVRKERRAGAPEDASCRRSAGATSSFGASSG